MDSLNTLRSANFQWATHIESVWSDPPYDVPDLHRKIRDDLAFRLDRLKSSTATDSPLGVVLVGQAGAGKTHLLSALRKETFLRGAAFVLIDLTDVNDFWATAQLGFLRALYKKGPTGREQFREILQHLFEHHLASASGLMDVEMLSKVRPPSLINHTNNLIQGLARTYRKEALEFQDVIRALVLVNSSDFELASLGDGWLQGLGIDQDEKFKHDFQRSEMAPSQLLRALAWLYSLRAPVVIALDQLDPIVAEHNLASEAFSEDPTIAARQRASLAIIERIASGLMALRDVTRRGLSVVSCVEATWTVLERKAIKSSTDRFEAPVRLQKPDSSDIARRIVARRLREAYDKAQFAPPYETWPFQAQAFVSDLSPREILKRCAHHVRVCVDAGKVLELTSFAGVVEPIVTPPVETRSPLDARFEALCLSADVDALKATANERTLDLLIEAGCTALKVEREDTLNADKDITVDKDFATSKSFEPLHARIRVIHHDQSDRETHYCLRYLNHPNAIAFQSRLNAAMTASGIDRALDFRKLRIVRFDPPPTGAKSAALIARFHAQGGDFVSLSDEDLRALDALAKLDQELDRAELDGWIRARRPTRAIPILAEAAEWLFGAAPKGPEPHLIVKPRDTSKSKPKPIPAPTPGASLPVGQRIIGSSVSSEVVGLPIAMLAKHTVVLAGAGSGKTVLVRRIVEEAALAGIPSIVVDVANDLARLGDPWPESPPEFDAEDAAKADRYFSTTETVVWTPGRNSGRPLRFEPLPDLSGMVGAGEEYQIALDLARSTLEPMVLRGKKTGQSGLLNAVLDYHARNGPSGLQGLIELLSELPIEAQGGFQKADVHARTMADALREQLLINPLLRSDGAALDPGVLFGDGAKGRCRISILNLMALPDLAVQQAFVNQLALTLFSWIKANPASGRPVRGLLVLDEAKDFVPSGRAVACRDSLLRLAAQARKYGLGLVFATQAPKSIDHNIIANCATQCYGRASSPAAFDVITEQIRQRGGSARDVAKLTTGTFYVHTEAMTAPAKIKAKLCLSHHPANPLDEPGIVERAKRSTPALTARAGKEERAPTR